MEELPITLHGSRCLIIGFGRIGKVLAKGLAGLGARVTVSARKAEDFAWIAASGYAKTDTRRLGDCLPQYDVVFNTVPSMILGKPLLELLKPGCLCVDLASKPGGIDFAAAAGLGVNCIWALSLPGKVAPHTSGDIIRDTLYGILDERGMLCP
jgi:dipicolinate synthase subunit A